MNKLLCTILLSISCIGHSANVEHIKISSYYVPGLVESDSSGSMIEMLKALEQVQPVKFDLSILPEERVQNGFKQGIIYSYFPELDESRHTPSCRTASFMQKKIIAVTLKGGARVESIEDLEGKSVGAVTGFSYGLAITNNKHIKLQRVNNDKMNLKKLLAGRIDVILGDAHSTVAEIEMSDNKKQLVFDVDKPIELLDVFFVFPSHSFGKVHCEQVSKGIETLRVQGELNRWFGYQ